VTVDAATVALAPFELDSILVTVSVFITVMVFRLIAVLGTVCPEVAATVELTVTVLVTWAATDGHRVGMQLCEDVNPDNVRVEHFWTEVAVGVIVFVTCLTHLRSSLSWSAIALVMTNGKERRVVQTNNDQGGAVIRSTTKGI